MCYFYVQNLPTIVMPLPRAGLAVVLLLSFFSAENIPGGHHSRTLIRVLRTAMKRFFTRMREFCAYAKGVFIVNAAWAAWEILVLLLSWCVAFLCFL
jgi:hypothetical protein